MFQWTGTLGYEEPRFSEEFIGSGHRQKSPLCGTDFRAGCLGSVITGGRGAVLKGAH